MNKFLLFILQFVFGQFGLSQTNIPIIRASSKNVIIKDGNHLKKGYWYILPDKKPDFYFVEIPEKPHLFGIIAENN